MPLTKTGKEVLKELRKKYGKKHGEEVLYAMISKKKKGSESWHLK